MSVNWLTPTVTSESSHRIGFNWVDHKVIEYLVSLLLLHCFFVERICLFKLDVVDDIIAIDYCHPVENVCIDQAPSESPFFLCLFLFLFRSLYKFLFWRVYPGCSLGTQCRPHTTLFELMGLAINLLACMWYVSPASFLWNLFTLLYLLLDRPYKLVIAYHLVRNIHFAPYTSSYKIFKGNFF